MRSLAILVLMLLVTGCGGSSLDARYATAANAAVQGQAPAGAGPASSGSSDDDATGVVDGPTGVDDGATSSGGDPDGPSEGAARPGGQIPVPPGGKAGGPPSCVRLKNQTGITDDTITLANVSDITGPVPGIFASAQQAVRAYAAYFNATATLCGRKLEVLGLDSHTDTAGDQVGYAKACDQAFAAVGSMAAFDSGGAATADRCGLPDVRSQAVSEERNACDTCFGAQATELKAFQNAVPDFFLAHNRAAARQAAMLYVNEAASVENAKNQQKAEEVRGMRFVYSAAFDVAEFNYSPYVQRMKQAGVRWVQFVGSPDQAVRMARAFRDNAFHPEVFLLDPTAYTPLFSQAGAAVEGSYVFVNFTPFEEAARSAELRLYEQWLHQVAPGAAPTYFGLYAWSAARLFVEHATRLGGELTRARLVASLARVHGWTAHGLHAPQDVGGKRNGDCWRFLRLHDGRWGPVGGTRYLCHGSTRVR